MEAVFDEFLSRHPIYREAYGKLRDIDPFLASSAQTVVELHGAELASVAEPILRWSALHYGPMFMNLYTQRIAALGRLQARFQASPSSETLGDTTAVVDRNAYDLALLLSLVFSNHRFELLQALKAFLKLIAQRSGRLASVGVGTGYELHEIADILSGWEIVGYDSDEEARRHADQLLRHFRPGRSFELGALFPLDLAATDICGRFQAIVMCELLEHLSNPLQALRTAREYLTADGHMFVTMAINIAQEDHVFLYRNAADCREQLSHAGLCIVREWLLPVVVHPDVLRRRKEFSKGNYAAIVTARGQPAEP